MLLSYCASISASHYVFSMWQSSVSFDGLATWVHSFPLWQGWVPWPRNHYGYFCQAAILHFLLHSGSWRWWSLCSCSVSKVGSDESELDKLDCDGEPTRPAGEHSIWSMILDAFGELAVLATAAACCSYKHALLFQTAVNSSTSV